MAVVRLVRAAGLPALEMLRLEEALLRAGSGNWVLVNDGLPAPAIVLGISGKPEVMLDVGRVARDRVQVLKRFSGGGTVIADRDTVFVSLILEEGTVDVEPYPRPIMGWTEGFYRPVFAPHAPPGRPFALNDTDYAYGDLKFGGNAQYITKGRWLHHTSFLWDYQLARMRYLSHPPKEPDYRRGRSHGDFLCKLKDVMPGRSAFVEGVVAGLPGSLGLGEVVETSLEEAGRFRAVPHLQSTKVIDV